MSGCGAVWRKRFVSGHRLSDAKTDGFSEKLDSGFRFEKVRLPAAAEKLLFGSVLKGRGFQPRRKSRRIYAGFSR
jgi:hypothetical protein